MKNFLILTLLFVYACNQPNSGGEMALMDASGNYEAASTKRMTSDEPITEQPAEPAMEKKVIKTGELTYQVKSIDKTYQKTTQLLESFDAYIENENQSTYGDRSQFSLTIRVPSEHFDSLLSQLADQSDVMEHRSVRVDDVTDRFYDLETRLKNKKALEKRYLELLDKATTVKEMLEIERNLNELRSDIEVTQGQFDYLGKQISYSTIRLTFYEILPYQYQPESRPGFMERIKISLGGGWQLFVSFVVVLIRLWPFLILIAVGVIAFRKYRRRKVKG